MNATSSCKTMQLDSHHSRLVEHPEGVEVSGLSGEVWLTQYGDSRDFVIRPGQRFVISQPGSVVLSTRQRAEVLLCRRDATPARRTSLWRKLASLFDPRWSGAVHRSLHRGRAEPG